MRGKSCEGRVERGEGYNDEEGLNEGEVYDEDGVGSRGADKQYWILCPKYGSLYCIM